VADDEAISFLDCFALAYARARNDGFRRVSSEAVE
jgi:hypothetical protein